MNCTCEPVEPGLDRPRRPEAADHRLPSGSSGKRSGGFVAFFGKAMFSEQIEPQFNEELQLLSVAGGQPLSTAFAGEGGGGG